MPTLNEITVYLHNFLAAAGNYLPCPQIDIFCGIMIAIVVLFAGAFLALLANLRNFLRERHQLGILEWLLDDREGGFINDTNTFYKMVLLNLNRSTLVYERVAVVSNLMGNQNIALNLSDLSDLTIAREEAQFKNQLVNFVIAVLLIIGLAGTFWAFRDILTNSGISQAISNNSLDVDLKYKEAINKIYGGFQHAFLASLAGIMGTVGLLFIKYLLVNPLRETFFYQLDWVTQTRLIPLFTGPNLTDQVTERLLVTATKFEAAVTHIQSLSQDLKDNVAYAKGLASELNQLSEKVRDIADLFKYTTGEESPFYKAASKLYDAVNQSQHHYEELGEGLDDLINQNQELIGQHREQNEQLKQAQTDFVKIHQQVNQHLEQVNTNFKTLTQQHLAKTGMVSKELQELLVGLKLQQVAYTTDFEQLVRRIKESALVVAEATQQFNVFLEKVNEHAKETIPQLSQIGFSGFMRKVDEHEKTLESQLQQNLQRLMGKLEEQTKDMLVQLNQMDSLKRIEQRMVDLPNKNDYSTEMQELVKVLREIQESLRKRTWLEWFRRK
jgi:hypothetical protein